jgi:DNA-directed RNA polymerase specialized sigma24 family protein
MTEQVAEQEFILTVEKNLGRFVGIVSRHLRLQKSDSEDVVQRALIKAWQKHQTCTGDLERWLISCCIHEGLDHLKSSSRYRKRLQRATMVKTMRPSIF